MKKILHISKYYPPYHGGIEDVCFNIVQTLKGEYIQKVICFNDSRNSILSEVDGVEVMRVGTICEVASQPVSLSFYSLLKKYIKVFKPDIVHLHVPNPFACVYLLQCLPSTVKLILHWHSDIIAQKSLYKLFAPIEKKILERSDRILVTSPQYLDYSVPLFHYKKKAVIIPNVVSLNKLQLKGCEAEIDELRTIVCKKRKIVFFMGRHVPYKGIEYLIEAEKYISSDCIILIAGSGPLTEELKKNTHSDRIKFIGRIPDKDIKIYMGAADVFAFPSVTKNEAFGVVLAEAMYCRTVPVTFTIKGSGVNWVSINGETGLEVENGNSEAFGKAIDLLLLNDKLRIDLAENAHKRVVDMFTMDTVQMYLQKVYM